MDIATIPIITKILLEESERVATPEIYEHVWRDICDLLAKLNENCRAFEPKL
ncbi:MAG: hypothetical protein FWE04_02050 [Oscillospiraceae bacterium]|nr:hypothetical protein [Oscillospiraceae bacterium]